MPEVPSLAGVALSAIPASPQQEVSAGAENAGLTPPAAGTTRSAYLPQLDGLRGVAVFMVFLHHAYAVPLLWSGVDLFFILSGYLITNILLRDSTRMSFGRMLGHFYLRRAQRILPAYLVCLLLIALLTVQPWARLWPYYAFFLQNLPYAFRKLDFSPLIPLWSLAVEQHFYLFWPFLVFFLPRRTLAPCMVALLLGLPVVRALCTPLFAYPEPIYVLTPFRIDTMAAGALAALWLPQCQRRMTLRRTSLAMAGAIAVYAALTRQPWFHRGANTPAFNGLAYSLNILILGGLFVWAVLAPLEHPLNRVLTHPLLRGLGRISYAFYLFQLLVFVRCSLWLPPRLAPPVCFFITAVAATASWYCLEKPVLSFGRNKPRLA